MKLDEAVTGNIYEPSPPPTDHPPAEPATPDSSWDVLGGSGAIEPHAPDDSTPVPVDEPPDETGVVTSGIEPGPIQRLVTSGVESLRDDLATGAGVVRDIVASAPRDVLTVGRAGVDVGRTAVGVGRAVGDRVFAGVPDVDGVAQMGARKLTNAVASVTKGGFLANGWGRFAKYRGRWEA